MPGVGTRMLEKTLSHLARTLELAQHTQADTRELHFIQSVDPRVKVIGSLLLTIAAVSARRYQVVLILLALLSGVVLLSHISWKRLLAAWLSGLFFAAVIAVPAIFTNGWQLSLLLVSRAETSLTCWLLVIMTTPFDRLLRALRSLYVPVVLIAILSMTYRYIFLLVETAQDMLLSRRSRIIGRLSPSDNRRLLVSTTGVLLSKSIQMSDDVYHAMASRGFRGEIRILDDFHMTGWDWFTLLTLISLSAITFLAGR